jgi:hypothetical protein
MPLNYFIYNDQIKNWTLEFVRELKAEISSLNIEHSPNSPSSRSMVSTIKGKTRQQADVVNRISIAMPRHAIYVHKGAGKGRGGSKGSTWINAKGEQKSTNPNSLGKMNTGNRNAKPWFDPIVDRKLPELEKIIGTNYGNMVINALKIKHNQ